MIYLYCESSTLLGSVAVFKNDQLLSYQESLRQGSHSNILNIFIEQALTEAHLKLSEIDLFVSGVGPGSFTGIRISLNAIKTFGFCYNKKVLGINSLENLAEQCEEKKNPIVAMINAYKNMVYIATYKKKGAELVVLKPPQVVRVQALSSYITDPVCVVGDGFNTYFKYFPTSLQSLMGRPLSPQDEPKASSAGPLIIKYAHQAMNWSKLLPLYLRSSEAEENALGIKFQPFD